MNIPLDTSSIDDYSLFLKIKSLPKYTFCGSIAVVPDEYAERIGVGHAVEDAGQFVHPPFLFDYQRDLAAMALRRKKFAVFADCGLGKTLILLEFASHVPALRGGRVLIVSPLMVVDQTIAEAARFYPSCVPTKLRANELAEWLRTGSGIAITNYEAITDELPDSDLSGLILDESSMMKSHYGSWASRLIDMGRGVEFKLCLTGTPAPNDRIEYANHAVFLDAFPNVNSFLARFFINRGQTNERWEMKAHAVDAFYESLSHWCFFLYNPGFFGWKDNCTSLPKIHVHIHDVPLTQEQRDAFAVEHNALFMVGAGGIGSRSKIARLGKGFVGDKKIESGKTRFIVDLVESFGREKTIIWCKYNAEQDDIAKAIPGCGNIDGSTDIDERIRIIDDFKNGSLRVLVTKPKILGFGLNLQCATRHIFSTLQDSYEEYYQAVKRSNRYGSTVPLNVHIPITDFERPMVETVLEKASRVSEDTATQERIFREHTARR